MVLRSGEPVVGSQTGLQWLASQAFPSFLGGLVGRWLVLKLVNLLKERGLVPKNLMRWLFRPVDPQRQKGEVSAAVATISAMEIPQGEIREFMHILGSLPLDIASAPDMANTAQIVRAMLAAFRVPAEEEIQEVTEEVPWFISSWVVLGMERRSPSPGVYPRGIAEKAKSVWDDVTSQFSFEISGLGERNPLREWAVAILIFQKAAFTKGVKPYISGVTPLSPSPQETSKRMDRLVERLDKGFSEGKKKLREVLKATRVEYNPGFLVAPATFSTSTSFFYLRFFTRIPMGSSTQEKTALKSRLTSLGFVHTPQGLKLAPPSQRWRLLLESENSEEWRLYLVFPFTETEGAFLTRVRNRGDILRELTRLGRRWKVDKKFPQSTVEPEEDPEDWE